MLINLHVKNLALIEETDVDFTDNLNILTGETGAGKSILIGSIQSALGSKIPRDMIRSGCDSASIELVFHTESEAVAKKMEEFDLPFEDGEVIISRRITNQRVINKVNDCSITISRLRELSPLLLDLSGQHENQMLLQPSNHRKILDNYHKTAILPLKKQVASLFGEYLALKRELQEKNMGEEERIREIEFLKYEMEEIARAKLQPEEDVKLEEEFEKISHAKEILSVCGRIHEMTSEHAASAGNLIGKSIRSIGEIEGLDGSLRELSGQLGTIDSLLSDFNRDLSDYISSMEFDAQTFSEMEERLNTINHLKAKYGDTIDKILECGENKKERLAQLENFEAFFQKLEEKKEQVKKELDRVCDALRKRRKEAAVPLAKAIREALLDLNFNEVQFEISFVKSEAYSFEGNDNVCFLISTNPGLSPRPLQEIASGGELSRIMLAIKSVLADEEQIETLIFDEIDTGISGRTAQKVSERLALLAKKRQVIAITHLPQIAAMASSHYLIEKTSSKTSTISRIYPLTKEESVQELARMLGGTKITSAVLENAKEMKALASGFARNIC